MLKRILILLILTITQLGCDAQYGEGLYHYEVIRLTDQGR